MQPLLAKLKQDYPELSFEPGKEFCWSPKNNKIYFDSQAEGAKARWSLLHETSHALLGHLNYSSDFDLLKIEVETWEQTRALASKFGIKIDENYIEDCLDTYRDWLHLRAACPLCGSRSAQISKLIYNCFNCSNSWRVSRSRLCRPYRLNKELSQI